MLSIMKLFYFPYFILNFILNFNYMLLYQGYNQWYNNILLHDWLYNMLLYQCYTHHIPRQWLISHLTSDMNIWYPKDDNFYFYIFKHFSKNCNIFQKLQNFSKIATFLQFSTFFQKLQHTYTHKLILSRNSHLWCG